MTTLPKRLIEVDLPIKRISAHARREKSIRHGHISTLHIWWARRPLAAVRAVICAALWPDPADEHCPPAFRETATQVMNAFAQRAMADKKLMEKASAPSMGRWNALAKEKLDAANPQHENVLRYALLDFIADFANWDNSTNETYLTASRTLTQAAHEALGGLPGTRPLVVDPFAGGGAIPLEALRVGADAFASDLNPVAVLLNKVVLEYIPKYGQQLADEVRKWGQWVKEQAEKELAAFYPPDPDGATPIAYLWARTITCEGPNCGAEVPLMRTLWLSKRKNHTVAVVFEKHEIESRAAIKLAHNPNPKKIGEGTSKGWNAVCPSCGYTTAKKRVQAQLSEQRGGANTSTLIAVVTLNPGTIGKNYRLPTASDFGAIEKVSQQFDQIQGDVIIDSLSLFPNEKLPSKQAHRAVGSQLPLYGFVEYRDLFTKRQLVALNVFRSLLSIAHETIKNEIKDDKAALAITTLLAFALDKQADYATSLCRWVPGGEFIAGILAGEKKYPMLSDFVEGNPISSSSGSWMKHINWIVRFIERESSISLCATSVVQRSAAQKLLPDRLVDGFVTDPPYFDSAPYSDLSNFYLVWLKRSLGSHYPDILGENLAPKSEEMTVDHPESVQETEKYKDLLSQAFSVGSADVKETGIGVIVFAHTSTAGWEALLSAIINSNWIVTASWPIDTERSVRQNALGTASLTSSVHIVTRPRKPDAQVGDWRDVLQELPGRIHEWLPRLAQEGVVGADAIFACLGPALEIFSRYARVEKASGEIITLGEYLEYVWAAVSKEALNMVFAGADTTGFEADARLTAMWLWTLNAKDEGGGMKDEEKVVASTGYVLEYDAARKIAQGLGAHLEQLNHLVEIKGGKSRLLPVAERTKYLFGKEGLAPTRRKRESGAQQLSLLQQLPADQAAEWRLDEESVAQIGQTSLDRVHQAMLLFAAGRSDALKRFLVANNVGQDESFWRLAQAFSALYPPATDEKRWIDGILARKKGLGF